MIEGKELLTNPGNCSWNKIYHVSAGSEYPDLLITRLRSSRDFLSRTIKEQCRGKSKVNRSHGIQFQRIKEHKHESTAKCNCVRVLNFARRSLITGQMILTHFLALCIIASYFFPRSLPSCLLFRFPKFCFCALRSTNYTSRIIQEILKLSVKLTLSL